MERILRANCNRCARKGCNGMVNPEQNCKTHVKPKDGFMLAEIALAYPSSLNEALSALPFSTNLDFHLR